MKKALIVLLVLAVAGGAFAEGFSAGGWVEAGFGVGITDADGAKPLVDWVENRGENGIGASIDLSYSSADDAAYGKYGAAVSFGAYYGGFNGDSFGVGPDAYNVWWYPTSVLRLQFGNFGNWDYGTPGGVGASWNVRGGPGGFGFELKPIDGLGIVATAKYGNWDGKWDGNATILENIDIPFAVKYTAANLLSVVGNGIYKGADGGDNKFDFGAGVNFLALSGVGLGTLAADVTTSNFGTDNLYLSIGEKVGFSASGLSLTVKAIEYLGIGDSVGTALSLPLYFQADVGYKLSDVVSLGIEGSYALGRKPSFNWRNANELGKPGLDAFSSKDAAALAISPSVTFNVGPTVKLGWNLQKDLTKGATGQTLQNLIYTTVGLSF